ncbi:non-hydrolyzing UDP-N-acetylglucosamine 2-epimerase [Cecembia lonarensis]|uniref:UDP-N-acetylglucosamine 2-epimerase n=1 Tax=Cecembia lonarensis (strain CCUG 58316 / KCTC 22772 / LW9) TaxID=1225176 RepID=K1KWT5_CECL9|nr:UDP-N-acetylglucosamine 2-epimerase (non-hydrolyzing) [Cecembia lonarensis]EKB48610.1 UDP-N-acetylglucosamine 2-epimerase [Cecembia lonarensis LW9]
MIKLFTVIGARPQFIKAAVISRLVRDVYKNQVREVLVHTGQHYDQNMSDIFFEDMDIPRPDFFLSINEKSHGAMTGKILIKLEELMINQKPDLVLVYGDTNSTLAGALAASKLHIPIAHVEAGLRSFWKKMPEEQNRILTDHLADFLFCPTDTAINNLKNESIINNVFNVGDIMLDSFNYYNGMLENKPLKFIQVDKQSDFNLNSLNKFSLLTLHRAENTTSKQTLDSIFENLNKLNTPIIFPVHPRTRDVIKSFGLRIPSSIMCVEPVGYFEMLYLLRSCERVITDSGGLQKEAFFAKKQCFTLRNQTEWVETLHNNCNTLLDPETTFHEIILKNEPFGPFHSYFGSGRTGKDIIDAILKTI